MTSTDKNLNQVVMNLLTKAQYDTKNANNEISDDEFYLLTDQDTLLNETQLAAVNSGITSALVNTIQTNQTNINSLFNEKQDIINESNLLPYEYLSNTPSIPTKVSDLTNDLGFLSNGSNNISIGSISGALVQDTNSNDAFRLNIFANADIKLKPNFGNIELDGVSSFEHSIKPLVNFSLGTSEYKFKDLYLSGNISDGTNTLTVADIFPKSGGKLTGSLYVDSYLYIDDITDAGNRVHTLEIYGLVYPSGKIKNTITFYKNTNYDYYTLISDEDGIDIDCNITPHTNNTISLGNNAFKFKDIFLAGDIVCGAGNTSKRINPESLFIQHDYTTIKRSDALNGLRNYKVNGSDVFLGRYTYTIPTGRTIVDAYINGFHISNYNQGTYSSNTRKDDIYTQTNYHNADRFIMFNLNNSLKKYFYAKLFDDRIDIYFDVVAHASSSGSEEEYLLDDNNPPVLYYTYHK